MRFLTPILVFPFSVPPWLTRFRVGNSVFPQNEVDSHERRGHAAELPAEVLERNNAEELRGMLTTIDIIRTPHVWAAPPTFIGSLSRTMPPRGREVRRC